MKKWLLLILAGVLTFSLAACHSDQNADASGDVVDTNSQRDNTKTQSEVNSILLLVLYNKKPFITQKGTASYLKDYKPYYKQHEDANYYEKDVTFVPRDYTFVDLDKDGKKELIVAEAPYADTYLILREENGKIYGYSLYIRWFQSLKQDGSFQSSGGALIHDYNTISFNINTYNISTFAKFYFEANNEKYSSDKYYFEPDHEKSVFEINGKQVSFEEIKQFAEEWDNRPGAEWIEFK